MNAACKICLRCCIGARIEQFLTRAKSQIAHACRELGYGSGTHLMISFSNQSNVSSEALGLHSSCLSESTIVFPCKVKTNACPIAM